MRWFWQPKIERSLCDCAHQPQDHLLSVWRGPGHARTVLSVSASEAHRVVAEFGLFDPGYAAHHLIVFTDVFGIPHRLDTSLIRAVGLVP